ncbi:uncharacterized protein B0H18DRAFT_869986 [Fomitopsis serialis]|uniref:uncharacterized protein n=1 Tax=Fomitopsis serialis TaxID=139415 RepID=UPI002007FDEE|nr:uncharacterized protein B0H18DRAFT_869986 [Neoantrodia serialis]KAH9934297.1 hypothetical protein B0H18DRAFT_869986 [Neoantrodia serialis]
MGTVVAPIPHTERKYQSYPGSNYVLPSDAAEKERLALQHRLLLHVLNNRIIMPDVTIGPADHILDSGTGTGIWLLDAMKIVPETTVLHGLDIEPGLFPREDHAVVSRGNVHFHVGSCAAMPSDWNGKFKLVNQRHMIAALRKEEWEGSIQEIFRVLEPGGWVQLGEVGYWKAGPETERFNAMATTVAKAKGLVLDCAVQIPDLLRETGFSRISVEPTLIPLGYTGGELAADGRKNWMAVFRGLKTPILKAGGFGHVSSEADFDSMMDKVENEWQNSSDAELQNNVICAQKPLI